MWSRSPNGVSSYMSGQGVPTTFQSVMACSWVWIWLHGQRSISVIPNCFRFLLRSDQLLTIVYWAVPKTFWETCCLGWDDQAPMYDMSLSGTAGSAEPTASRFSKNGRRGFLELCLRGASDSKRSSCSKWFAWAAFWYSRLHIIPTDLGGWIPRQEWELTQQGTSDIYQPIPHIPTYSLIVTSWRGTSRQRVWVLRVYTGDDHDLSLSHDFLIRSPQLPIQPLCHGHGHSHGYLLLVVGGGGWRNAVCPH